MSFWCLQFSQKMEKWNGMELLVRTFKLNTPANISYKFFFFIDSSIAEISLYALSKPKFNFQALK